MIRTISIPYYTSSMDLHVEEKNLKTVITAKTEDYVPEKSPKELIEDALHAGQQGDDDDEQNRDWVHDPSS